MISYELVSKCVLLLTDAGGPASTFNTGVSSEARASANLTPLCVGFLHAAFGQWELRTTLFLTRFLDVENPPGWKGVIWV